MPVASSSWWLADSSFERACSQKVSGRAPAPLPAGAMPGRRTTWPCPVSRAASSVSASSDDLANPSQLTGAPAGQAPVASGGPAIGLGSSPFTRITPSGRESSAGRSVMTATNRRRCRPDLVPVQSV